MSFPQEGTLRLGPSAVTRGRRSTRDGMSLPVPCRLCTLEAGPTPLPPTTPLLGPTALGPSR